MKWANPVNPQSVTGKQTLSGDKPITQILKAIKEIQDLAVTGGNVMINGSPLSVSIVDNKIFISGTISAISDYELPKGDVENHVLCWNGSEWEAGPVRAL